MGFENYCAEDIYQQMNQHWCPRTLGAGLLTGPIYSHIFLFLKKVFFWCFVQIFLLRRTGLVLCPLQLPALTPGVLGALSAPTAVSIHGRELLVCPVLCQAWPWLQGWSDQFPASCWVHVAPASSLAVHVSSRNPEPQVLASSWLVFSTTMTHQKFILFKICYCGFWGNPVFVLGPSMGCV